MKFSIRDLLWATIVVSLAVALWLEHGRYQKAAQEVKDRELENDYYVGKLLKLEKELYGTLENPKLGNKRSAPPNKP